VLVRGLAARYAERPCPARTWRPGQNMNDEMDGSAGVNDTNRRVLQPRSPGELHKTQGLLPGLARAFGGEPTPRRGAVDASPRIMNWRWRDWNIHLGGACYRRLAPWAAADRPCTPGRKAEGRAPACPVVAAGRAAQAGAVLRWGAAAVAVWRYRFSTGAPTPGPPSAPGCAWRVCRAGRRGRRGRGRLARAPEHAP
jgi:hypothetical protein